MTVHGWSWVLFLLGFLIIFAACGLLWPAAAIYFGGALMAPRVLLALIYVRNLP